MKKGQQCFFYHSNCKIPGIVGIVEVVRESYPDHTAFDKSSEYYDAKSDPEKPKWFMVDVKMVRKLERQITLNELKSNASDGLKDMALFKMSRLSVQPVSEEHWSFILGLEGQSKASN